MQMAKRHGKDAGEEDHQKGYATKKKVPKKIPRASAEEAGLFAADEDVPQGHGTRTRHKRLKNAVAMVSQRNAQVPPSVSERNVRFGQGFMFSFETLRQVRVVVSTNGQIEAQGLCWSVEAVCGENQTFSCYIAATIENSLNKYFETRDSVGKKRGWVGTDCKKKRIQSLFLMQHCSQ